MARIDRALLKAMRPELDRAVAEIAERHGVKIKVAKGVYGDTTGKFTLEIAAVDKDGTVHTREAFNFENMCYRFGLARSDLGREFKSAGVTFVVKGLKGQGRARKPILCERKRDGKMFVFGADAIRYAFAADARAPR